MAFETKFAREAVQESRGISKLRREAESLRIVRMPGGIFNVVDFVPEALQADDVMDVLPDHPGHWDTGHEAHHDQLLAFHGGRAPASALQVAYDRSGIAGHHHVRWHAFRDNRASSDD